MISTEKDGRLRSLNDKCILNIPGFSRPIKLKILPEISDSKSARYADEPVIGRSTPLKSYSHSDNRVISMKLHFQAISKYELNEIKENFWAISSLTYPRRGTGGPYAPPPICTFTCGQLFGMQPLCLILENYSLNVPTDVVWDDETLVPYYYYLNTTWHTVYSSSYLPNQEDILQSGGGL